jgi:hypothetical protein
MPLQIRASVFRESVSIVTLRFILEGYVNDGFPGYVL